MILMQVCRRFIGLLFISTLIVGCSSSGPQTTAGAPGAGAAHSNECRWNRSRCIYEGSYEAGERDYAEEEARRLNQATIQRLRRGAWR